MIKDCICIGNLCAEPDNYDKFDSLIKGELKLAFTGNGILNTSSDCAHISNGWMHNDKDDTITVSDILESQHGKHGVYHLWLSESGGVPCPVHGTHSMRCIYVGKGELVVRSKAHIRDKIEPNADFAFARYAITFFECKNRISKYLEQLFLDLYDIEKNKNENDKEQVSGRHLYGYWKQLRYEAGTETAKIADKHAIRQFLAGTEE